MSGRFSFDAGICTGSQKCEPSSPGWEKKKRVVIFFFKPGIGNSPKKLHEVIVDVYTRVDIRTILHLFFSNF